MTVAEVTTRIRNIPVEVALDQKDGMPKKCVINLDTLATIKKSTLEKRITFLSDEKIILVDRALKFSLAIP